MVPFAMIMDDKLGARATEMPLTERNHPIQTHLFDRADEALGVGVRIRRLVRRLDDAEPASCKCEEEPRKMEMKILRRERSFLKTRQIAKDGAHGRRTCSFRV